MFCKTHSGFIVFHPSAPRLCHEVDRSTQPRTLGSRLQAPPEASVQEVARTPEERLRRCSNRFQTKLKQRDSEQHILITQRSSHEFYPCYFLWPCFQWQSLLLQNLWRHQCGSLVLWLRYDFWHCDACFCWHTNIMMSLCHFVITWWCQG